MKSRKKNKERCTKRKNKRAHARHDRDLSGTKNRSSSNVNVSKDKPR